jgi:hypothetical protein
VPSNLWYRNAVIYSLSVETFKDRNGDGVGDFAGLRRRLDYLEGLGVDVIWLAPSQPTPNRDDGYDVADYYVIDPRFGSSGDFADFMADADGRGIRVLLDLVVNHTSDRHPWFLDASPRGFAVPRLVRVVEEATAVTLNRESSSRASRRRRGRMRRTCASGTSTASSTSNPT